MIRALSPASFEPIRPVEPAVSTPPQEESNRLLYLPPPKRPAPPPPTAAEAHARAEEEAERLQQLREELLWLQRIRRRHG